MNADTKRRLEELEGEMQQGLSDLGDLTEKLKKKNGSRLQVLPKIKKRIEEATEHALAALGEEGGAAVG